MSDRTIMILYPIWIGIAVNIIFSIVNISLIDHDGRVASAYMKHAPLVLGVIWVMLIGLSIFNYF